MNQFYVYTILAGIGLILLSLGLVAYDRKKALDYTARLDEKKEELTGIIADADQMIDEMNRFSDYIVTQMDLKNQEMSSNLRMMEERIKEVTCEMAVLEKPELTAMESQIIEKKAVAGDIQAPVVPLEDFAVHAIAAYKSQVKSRDKVIPINNKAHGVIQLAKSGLSDTEIAKSLKMGKGEVQLILEMNK